MATRTMTLTEQVAQQVIDEIQRGVFPVGSKLPPGKALAARFGVSPAVIREVTERLRAKGLIDSRQGAGCTVKSNTEASGFSIPGTAEADLSRMFELRMDLEGAAAALAAVRRGDADLAALRRLLKTLEENLYDPAQGVELDVGFHVAIAQATRNRYYVDLLQYLNLQFRQCIGIARAHSAQHYRLPEEVHREHVRVFDAILAGDPAAARLAMTTHLERAARRLGVPLEPSPADAADADADTAHP
ncbi:FadR family transcriptional regulator [Burkholderia sp. WAC0059]|uniref:FadR/GntR family transcriptional regulator n=1 Tax=Burkholderia sp. WAC0059 TaxID=2066022 RepID=UPI000C7F1509|nr:FadR/GntR family transcriptional regulator [Burkholderia sp. WAC0059]PLZ00991.1 FadR family transcriptional regulator [Burkholderia sp. WAC0059]